MTETWKEIPGYEGRYEASTQGRIRNYKTKKVLSLRRTDRSGYLIVRLPRNGKRVNFKVHRLVALTFLPNPENKPAVDHVNRDRQNNSVDNLRWVTWAENAVNRDGASPGKASLLERIAELEERVEELERYIRYL